MRKEIIISVVSSLLGALIAFVAGKAFNIFTTTISDSQVQQVAKQLVDTESYRDVLLTKMAKSEQFKGARGDKGDKGERGVQGEKGDPPDIRAVKIKVSMGNCKSPADSWLAANLTPKEGEKPLCAPGHIVGGISQGSKEAACCTYELLKQ